MFRISAKTCREFKLAEVLIMAAMNDAETARLASGGRVETVTAATLRGYRPATHFLRANGNALRP
jgi:hypothetical protein